MTNESGAVLLEASAALALLGFAGGAVVGVVGAGLHREYRLAQVEQEVQAADRLLAGLTLLARRDLDRRLGARPEGAFVVVVTRPEPTLYRLSVAAVDAPDVDILATVVFRERQP